MVPANLGGNMADLINKKTGEVLFEEQPEHTRGLAGYNSKGEEILDPRPVALPASFTRPKTLQETMKDLLRNEELKRALDRAEADTFDEAEDFGTDENDPLARTPYEDIFDPEAPGIAAREQEIRAGAVADRPLEKKVEAHETVKKWKNWKKGRRAAPKNSDIKKTDGSVSPSDDTGDEISE